MIRRAAALAILRTSLHLVGPIIRRHLQRKKIGKLYLGYQTPNTANDRGFDEFYGFLGGTHPYTPSQQVDILWLMLFFDTI